MAVDVLCATHGAPGLRGLAAGLAVRLATGCADAHSMEALQEGGKVTR